MDPSAGVCHRCSTSLASIPEQSLVGMTLDVRRKLLGSRPGVCIPGPDQQLLVHLEADKTVPLTDVKYEVVKSEDESMAPACRLFTRATTAESVKWDRALLWSTALSVASSDLASSRALFDLALARPHPEVLDWLSLSPSEKAWRRAHTAASRGDLPTLLSALAELPEQGYRDRVALLMPYLPHLTLHRTELAPLLDTWAAAGLPHAQLVATATLRDGRTALGAALALHQGAPEAVDASFDLAQTPPPTDDCHTWSGLRAYGAALSARTHPTGLELASLPLEMVEDLVDAGILDHRSDLRSLAPDVRPLVASRVAPFTVSPADLARVGHTAELARRHYLNRDDAALDALVETADVQHYRALRAVINGFAPGEGQLRPEVVAILDQAQADRTRLGKEPGQVSSPVMSDPTVWPLLAEVARQGHILTEPTDDFGRWVAMHRVVGLLWEGKYAEAVALGERLAPLLTEEVEQDEALNLVAFAKSQLGRADDALRTIEQALEGAYTHNLLVNASVLAKRANPHSAMKLLARLVREAPSEDLKVAAMCSAINVLRTTSDEEIPTDLATSLPDVLRLESSLPDFQFLLRFARERAPRAVIGLSSRTGEADGVLRLAVGHARLKDDPTFDLSDLADTYIDVHRAFGRPAWFDQDWNPLSEMLRESMFTDFGTVVGSTLFWKRIFEEAEDLVTETTRLQLLPQVGAHLSVAIADQGDSLAPRLFPRYFFDVYEQLLAARHRLDEEGSFVSLSRNLCRCLVVAGHVHMGTNRDRIADIYNDHVKRLRWDHENRGAILNRMRETLNLTNEPLDLLDRIIHRATALKVGDEHIRERLAKLIEGRDEWRQEVARLRRDL